MRAFSRWIALATLLSGVAAHADRNDLRISLLKNPDEGEANHSASANADFQAFARAMSASLTSVNLMPPKTLGHAGFNVNAELSVVSLPKDILIPMEGGQPGTLLVPGLHVRKGMPFSVELGGRVSWVEKSRMVAATGEVKWAINEGFSLASHHRKPSAREAAAGGKPEEQSAESQEESGFETFMRLLPDLSARGHVTRLLGVRDFSLTTGGLDLSVGKMFPVGGMVTFTPYGGLDFTFVGADSDNIDFRPDRPYNETLGNDSLAALEDTGVYKRVEFSDNMTQRLYGGVRFIGGVLQLGAEISFTRLGNAKMSDDANSDTRSLPTVVTFNTSLGLDF